MRAPTGAHVRYIGNGTVEVTFAYRRWVVDQIKQLIPPNCRSYDPDTRTWLVTDTLAPLAIEILTIEFGDDVAITHDSIRRPEPTPIRKTDAAFATLYVLPNAPACVVAAAYRALAREHHPDKGGKNEAMKQVNLAFEALRKVGAA